MMKLSQNQTVLLRNAVSLEIVYYDGGIFDDPGYAIRLYNSYGDWGLLNRGKPIVYKTPNGAFKSACNLRPDLFPYNIFWGI